MNRIGKSRLSPREREKRRRRNERDVCVCVDERKRESRQQQFNSYSFVVDEEDDRRCEQTNEREDGCEGHSCPDETLSIHNAEHHIGLVELALVLCPVINACVYTST